MQKRFFIFLLCLLPCFSFSQNLDILDSENGYREFKFGMTSEQIRALNIFPIPPSKDQYVAAEYQNQEVTYTGFADLDKFQANIDNQHAYYNGAPIKYICFLFYQNKLFKIRLHFYDEYADKDYAIFENSVRKYDGKAVTNGNSKTATVLTEDIKYEAISENGTNTTIIFEKHHVEHLIKENIPYDDKQLVKYKTPKVYALLVGVSDYSKSKFQAKNLDYAANDAQVVYDFFRSPEGGGVPEKQLKLLVNGEANKKQIIASAESIFSKAKYGDLVVFFFSGHGGPNVFAVSDELIFHKELKNIIYKSNAKIKLCLADACHAGSWDKKFSMKLKDVSPEQIAQFYYQTLAAVGDGTALFMASDSDESSIDDPELKQGLFTYFLIEGLKGKADVDENEVITINELYNYVMEKVKDRAAYHYMRSQTPQLTGNFDVNTPIAVKLKDKL